MRTLTRGERTQDVMWSLEEGQQSRGFVGWDHLDDLFKPHPHPETKTSS